MAAPGAVGSGVPAMLSERSALDVTRFVVAARTSVCPVVGSTSWGCAIRSVPAGTALPTATVICRWSAAPGASVPRSHCTAPLAIPPLVAEMNVVPAGSGIVNRAAVADVPALPKASVYVIDPPGATWSGVPPTARFRWLPFPTKTAPPTRTPPNAKAVTSWKSTAPSGGGGLLVELSTATSYCRTVLSPGASDAMFQDIISPNRQPLAGLKLAQVACGNVSVTETDRRTVAVRVYVPVAVFALPFAIRI